MKERKEKRSKIDFVELTVCGPHLIDFPFIIIIFFLLLKDEKVFEFKNPINYTLTSVPK